MGEGFVAKQVKLSLATVASHSTMPVSVPATLHPIQIPVNILVMTAGDSSSTWPFAIYVVDQDGFLDYWLDLAQP